MKPFFSLLFLMIIALSSTLGQSQQVVYLKISSTDNSTANTNVKKKFEEVFNDCFQGLVIVTDTSSIELKVSMTSAEVILNNKNKKNAIFTKNTAMQENKAISDKLGALLINKDLTDYLKINADSAVDCINEKIARLKEIESGQIKIERGFPLFGKKDCSCIGKNKPKSEEINVWDHGYRFGTWGGVVGTAILYFSYNSLARPNRELKSMEKLDNAKKALIDASQLGYRNTDYAGLLGEWEKQYEQVEDDKEKAEKRGTYTILAGAGTVAWILFNEAHCWGDGKGYQKK